MEFSAPCWYELDDSEDHNFDELNLCNQVFARAEEIERDQADLRNAWKKYARAYSNREEVGLDWDLDCSTELDTQFVTENVVKSVIDTAASIIAKNRVRCRVMTNGADFTGQRKARRLEKYIYAEMKAREAWVLGPLVFRDACIFGTGVVKVFPDADNKVRLERRLISDVLVDERRAIDGKPTEMFEKCMLDIETVKKMFPKKADRIQEAYEHCDDSSWGGKKIPEGKVVLVEAWKLGKKHCICMANLTLFEESYDEPEFPFVFFRWDGLPISGFYGLGLARDLYGFQQRINQLNRFIERCQDLIATPRVFVDMASKMLKVQLDNKIGAIIPYRGNPPQFMTAQAVGQEIYSYKEYLKRAAFEFAGISQLSAQSLKPAGLESAVALREYSDIETSRFVIQSQRYEKLFTDLGVKIVDCTRRMFSKGNQPKAKFPNQGVLELIEWKDVDMEDDRFELDVQPASLLSMSPSARLQAVTELAQVGQLDKSEIRYLLNHPDLEASTDLATADFKMAQKVEEQLLDGEPVVPEPFFNLDLMLRRTQLLYQMVQVDYDDVPDDVLEGIRTFISQCKSLQEQAMQQGVPQQAVPGTDPAAAAGATPVAGSVAGGVAGSDVIQNLAGPITNG